MNEKARFYYAPGLNRLTGCVVWRGWLFEADMKLVFIVQFGGQGVVKYGGATLGNGQAEAGVA